jgi:hypothetical protein
MVISGELRLAVSLALFAIAGIISWRFRYYLAADEWVRTFGMPPPAPRHVFTWFLIAVALCFVGAFMAPPNRGSESRFNSRARPGASGRRRCRQIRRSGDFVRCRFDGDYPPRASVRASAPAGSDKRARRSRWPRFALIFICPMMARKPLR